MFFFPAARGAIFLVCVEIEALRFSLVYCFVGNNPDGLSTTSRGAGFFLEDRPFLAIFFCTFKSACSICLK